MLLTASSRSCRCDVKPFVSGFGHFPQAVSIAPTDAWRFVQEENMSADAGSVFESAPVHAVFTVPFLWQIGKACRRLAWFIHDVSVSTFAGRDFGKFSHVERLFAVARSVSIAV